MEKFFTLLKRYVLEVTNAGRHCQFLGFVRSIFDQKLMEYLKTMFGVVDREGRALGLKNRDDWISDSNGRTE